MPITEMTAVEWLNLVTHLKRWLSNLLRARTKRKAESKEALRSVIRAVRETEIYIRQLKEGGKKSIKAEEKLSLRWTDLSFLLGDLKLEKLAKRCEIKGRYWADPSRYDSDFLNKVGTKLPEVERVALLALAEISKKGRRS
jgi:hypothetical protein